MDIIFKSERMDFVNVSICFVDDYLVMMNNSDVQDFVSIKSRVFDYDGEVEWINSKISDGSCIYSFVERVSGKFVGNVEFMNILDGKSELGICITPSFWNKHFGIEVLLRVIDYGFNDLGLDEIYLKVFSHNSRAIHCYKKVGFVEYDVLKGVKVSNGVNVDEIYMKIKK